MDKHAFVFIWIFLFAIPFSVQAESENCFHRDAMEDYRNLIQKTAVIDEDGRRTEEEYAREKRISLEKVQSRFAATGKLKCGSGELTAQLTGANDVISTAGHAFFNTKTCAKTTTPDTCTFTVKIGKIEKTSRVSRLVEMGIRCPRKPDDKDDWAVLKIDPPIDGVTPYGLPDQGDVKEGENITSVSAGAQEFRRVNPVTGKKEMVKTIDECQSRHVYGITRATVFESTCDSDRGNSGGSVIRVEKGRDVLVGITKGNMETEKMMKETDRTGIPRTAPYKENVWSTYHVPLNHDFLRAVETAMGGRPL